MYIPEVKIYTFMCFVFSSQQLALEPYEYTTPKIHIITLTCDPARTYKPGLCGTKIFYKSRVLLPISANLERGSTAYYVIININVTCQCITARKVCDNPLSFSYYPLSTTSRTSSNNMAFSSTACSKTQLITVDLVLM